MKNIKEQLMDIGNDLALRSGLAVEVEVKDSLTISLKSNNKNMDFYIASTHVLDDKREYLLVCSELENHNHTRLEVALLVGLVSGEVEYIDYPPHNSIIKHFTE